MVLKIPSWLVQKWINTQSIFILGDQRHPFIFLHYSRGVDWHPWHSCSFVPDSPIIRGQDYNIPTFSQVSPLPYPDVLMTDTDGRKRQHGVTTVSVGLYIKHRSLVDHSAARIFSDAWPVTIQSLRHARFHSQRRCTDGENVDRLSLRNSVNTSAIGRQSVNYHKAADTLVTGPGCSCPP